MTSFNNKVLQYLKKQRLIIVTFFYGGNMQIIKKKIDELKPANYNPRKNLKPGDKEYEKLKKSIKEFGYVEPVIYNKRTGIVVGGHQRLKVLKDLGYEEIGC